MTFAWRYLDAAGTLAGSSDAFGSREEAEAWIGEAWPDLLDQGVEEVELVRGEPSDGEPVDNEPVGGEPVYRMSLRPASG